MKLKKLLCTALSAVIIVGCSGIDTFAARYTAQATFSAMNVKINGQTYNMRPIIIDGTSYFPVRTVGHMLNCSVEWISSPKQVILTSQSSPTGSAESVQGSGNVPAIFDDSIVIKANGRNVDTPVAIIDNRSYIPLKKVAEAMGKRVDWYNDKREISIVNPETISVDESLKNYYVYRLPETINDADYIVGNWTGESRFNDGQINRTEVFISKNADGTYKVVNKETIVAFPEDKELVGDYIAYESIGNYDSETRIFTIKATERIALLGHRGFNNYAELIDNKVNLVDTKFTFDNNNLLNFYNVIENTTSGYLKRF